MASPLKPSFLSLSDAEFLAHLQSHAKFKQRTHDTHHNIHLPELTARLNLSSSMPATPSPPQTATPAPAEDESGTTPANHSEPANISPIHAIYLGNSHLERLKTSGCKTQLHTLCKTGSGVAFNAGVGGDKNENVIWRLAEGLYSILRAANHPNHTSPNDNNNNPTTNNNNATKVWLLISGTNNLHPKHGLRARDVETWKLLLQSCLRIAPRSRVLAVDVWFRNDVHDAVVERANEALEGVVRDVNREVRAWEGEANGGDRVVWVECRYLITGEMLDDHVHLNEEGYGVLNRVVVGLVLRELGFEAERKLVAGVGGGE